MQSFIFKRKYWKQETLFAFQRSIFLQIMDSKERIMMIQTKKKSSHEWHDDNCCPEHCVRKINGNGEIARGHSSV